MKNIQKYQTLKKK